MFKYLILLYLLLSINLSAEIIQKLEVKGNNRISKETIIVYGDINLNENYTNLDIDNVLKNLYKTNFFEDIKISLNNGILNINVKEHKVINTVDLRGEKSATIKSKVLEELKLKSKESFIENQLTEDIKKIKQIYSSIGFNFTEVKAKIENFDNDRVNLIYFLEKGNKSYISQINFIGDKKIKEKRLRDIIVSEEKKFWKFLSNNTFLNYNNIELDKRLLVNYYKSLGYYDIQVLSNSAEIGQNNSTSLVYTINAGTRYRVRKISTNVSEVLDKKAFIPLQKSFTEVVGKYYSPFAVKKLLDNLDLLIADSDLQFIEHSVNEILEGDTIEIKINIYEGKKLLVEKINILGNSVTEEGVIRSELLLDEGDPFNSLKLDQSIAKIKSRNIFGDVKKIVNDGSQKDQKIIDIILEEKPTGEISAGAGIGTSGGSFAFNVKENNWLGKGIAVKTSVDVSKQSFSGGLDVVIPNYNFSGNSVNYFLENKTNKKPDSGFKNNILSAGVGTSFEQYRNIYLAPSIAFSRDTLSVESSASDALKKQKGTFSDLSGSYSISLDNRDKTYAPTDGYISSFSQSFPLYADSPYLKNRYSFKQYKSFSPDMIGSFKAHASAINGLSDKDVRLSKRLGLSTYNLRGFESGKIGPKDGNDYVGGNYTLATNFEMNLPNLLPESTNTDVGLFLDFGNIWKVDYDSQIDDSNKIRSLAGINTSWLSPVGPMSFILSQNLSKASTDVTESFNFRLGTTF
jgi:outer membrane protein insertion porin family